MRRHLGQGALMGELSPRYLATMNTPGFLPWDDDRHLFDTAAGAWEYLIGRRNEAWNADDEAQGPDWAMHNMGGMAIGERCGTVYGSTPGYDGSHDLGIAYTVTKVKHS